MDPDLADRLPDGDQPDVEHAEPAQDQHRRGHQFTRAGSGHRHGWETGRRA